MVYIEIANPNRKLIKSKQEYLDFIKKNNGINNLYHSLFKFKYLKNKYSPDYDSAIINKLFFDCDSNDSLHVTKKFHNYLIEKDIKHYLLQSSYMRFHIYILCKNENLTYKKNALFNSMIYLAQENGFKVEVGDKGDFDKSTFGDLSQICPIPNTFKPKRNCFVSYISYEDLFDSNTLYNKAKKGCKDKIIYGTKLFSLKEFDKIIKENKSFIDNNFIVDGDDFNVEFNDKLIDSLPPFIKKVLSNYKGYCDDYKNRWRVALYMRDMGYPQSLVEDILKKYYSQYLNYSTCNGTCTQWDRFKKCKALDYTFHGEFKEFPTIDSLLQEGWEITKEDEIAFNNLYMK